MRELHKTERQLLGVRSLEDVGKLINFAGENELEGDRLDIIVGIFDAVYRKRRMQLLIDDAFDLISQKEIDLDSPFVGQDIGRIAAKEGVFTFHVDAAELGARTVMALAEIKTDDDLKEIAASIFNEEDEADYHQLIREFRLKDWRRAAAEKEPKPILNAEECTEMLLGKKLTIGHSSGETHTVDVIPTGLDRDNSPESVIIDIDGSISIFKTRSLIARSGLNLILLTLGNFGQPVPFEKLIELGAITSTGNTETDYIKILDARKSARRVLGGIYHEQRAPKTRSIDYLVAGFDDFVILDVSDAREVNEKDQELILSMKHGVSLRHFADSRTSSRGKSSSNQDDHVKTPKKVTRPPKEEQKEPVRLSTPQALAVTRQLKKLGAGRHSMIKVFELVTRRTTSHDLGQFAEFVQQIATQIGMSCELKVNKNIAISDSPDGPLPEHDVRSVNTYFIEIS